MKTLTPDTPIASLPSVGAKRLNALSRLGLETVEDIVFFYPRRYIDLRNFKKISSLVPGERASIKGRVMARDEKRPRGGRFSYLTVAVSDGTGVIFVVFFNQPYLKSVFTPDSDFFIHGRVDTFKAKLQVVNPLYEEEKPGRRDWLLPVYPLSGGLTHKNLRKLIKYSLDNLSAYPEELLGFKERQRLGLANMKFALANIHFPASDINLEKARDYLIFREFLLLQLGLLVKKQKTQQTSTFSSMDILSGKKIIDEFQAHLPFKLTAPQKNVMCEILDDLKQGKVMSRLVHGEVGSGKTAVAVFILWLFAKLGCQAALLSPTEILAEQHFLNWHGFFMEQDIPAGLLLGQLPESEKKKMREKILKGDIKVVIGTHALLAEKSAFKKLKAAVVDEQHKFGVKQREMLKTKGQDVHYIVMSATPIPRSVALTFYGALDISTMGEMPRGERNVITYIFPGEEKEKIYKFLEYQSSRGNQGYIVTPAIEGSENIASAIAEYQRIRRHMPDIPASLLHGRLSHTEKEDIMKRFRNKDIRMLVATTVIESGIDVPGASYIIVEQAERFGLAQLHQLRGRVGRTGDTGYCILVPYDEANSEAMHRLESFVQAESGFEIAEIDLKLRGQGDLLGIRQHGIPALKIGNIVKDLEALKRARKEAEGILRQMPAEEIERKFLKGGMVTE